jgi:hypothetical protein
MSGHTINAFGLFGGIEILEIGFSGLEFVVGFPMDEIFPSGSERIATRFSSSFFLVSR